MDMFYMVSIFQDKIQLFIDQRSTIMNPAVHGLIATKI